MSSLPSASQTRLPKPWTRTRSERRFMPGKSFAAAVTRASSDACKVLATEHLRACGLSAAWNIAYWGVRARSTLKYSVWLLKHSLGNTAHST